MKLTKWLVQEDLILKSIKISNNVIIFTSFHFLSSPLILAIMVNVVTLKIQTAYLHICGDRAH